MSTSAGKISKKDEMLVRLWEWLPWTSFLLLALSAPVGFSIPFITSTEPQTAVFFLMLVFSSLALGSVVALTALIILLFFRRRWLRSLRDRLAQDGVTAKELPLFAAELTSYERKTLSEIKKQNPLLADAYSETLASRLTASRIISRVRNEQLEVERRINRARSLSGTDTATLLRDLQLDHARIESLRSEATSCLSEARARLQVIEAAARRSLSQKLSDSMLRRLTESQNQIPLGMELVRLEQEAEDEARQALKTASAPNLSHPDP